MESNENQYEEYIEDITPLLNEMVLIEAKIEISKIGRHPFFLQVKEEFSAENEFLAIKKSYEETTNALGIVMEIIPENGGETNPSENSYSAYLILDNNIKFISFLSSLDDLKDETERSIEISILLQRVACGTVAYMVKLSFEDEEGIEDDFLEDVFSKANEIIKEYNRLKIKEDIIPYKRMFRAYERGYLKEFLRMVPYMKAFEENSEVSRWGDIFKPEIFKSTCEVQIQYIQDVLDKNPASSFLFKPIREYLVKTLLGIFELTIEEDGFDKAIKECISKVENLKPKD